MDYDIISKLRMSLAHSTSKQTSKAEDCTTNWPEVTEYGILKHLEHIQDC